MYGKMLRKIATLENGRKDCEASLEHCAPVIAPVRWPHRLSCGCKRDDSRTNGPGTGRLSPELLGLKIVCFYIVDYS